MKKSLLMLACATALAFTACNRAEQAESETVATTDPVTGEVPDTEAMYRDQASRVTKKMASDLQMEDDAVTQDKIQEVYYTRAKRAGDIRQRHSADTSGMYAELREINLDTDKEFETILTPDQLKRYQTRRNTYYTELDDITILSSATGTKLSPNAEITTKTEKDGDRKIEIEDGDTEIKIKRDADGETKIKTTTKN